MTDDFNDHTRKLLEKIAAAAGMLFDKLTTELEQSADVAEAAERWQRRYPHGLGPAIDPRKDAGGDLERKEKT